MKATKQMLVFLGTLLITWLATAAVVCLLTEHSYRDSLVLEGTLVFMLIIGWMPSIIVTLDYEETYG